MDLLFILGGTCVGKSTFLTAVQEVFPTQIGLVEVGKTMRKMFPPEHFKGSAAPDHTEKLAMQLFKEGIAEHVDAQKQLILVDGQPRRPSQVGDTAEHVNALGIKFRYLHLFAPLEVRAERARKRFAPEDKGSLDLALARLTGDLPALYEVLGLIESKYPNMITLVNTDCPGYDPVLLLKSHYWIA